jgi:hypothetical protein
MTAYMLLAAAPSLDPASSSTEKYLGKQGDMEIRWSPAPHLIAAFNLAGFQPGGFFHHVGNNRPPIAANAGSDLQILIFETPCLTR